VRERGDPLLELVGRVPGGVAGVGEPQQELDGGHVRILTAPAVAVVMPTG
jgi:hypothetical protein